MYANYISWKLNTSPAANRTPASRMTGGDTNQYTTEEYKLLFATTVIKLLLSNVSLTKINNIDMLRRIDTFKYHWSFNVSFQ